MTYRCRLVFKIKTKISTRDQRLEIPPQGTIALGSSESTLLFSWESCWLFGCDRTTPHCTAEESCTSGLLLEAVELHERPSRYQNHDCRSIRPPWIPSAWLPSLAFTCMLTYSWFRAAWTSKLNCIGESMLALNLRSCPECG